MALLHLLGGRGVNEAFMVFMQSRDLAQLQRRCNEAQQLETPSVTKQEQAAGSLETQQPDGRSQAFFGINVVNQTLLISFFFFKTMIVEPDRCQMI